MPKLMAETESKDNTITFLVLVLLFQSTYSTLTIIITNTINTTTTTLYNKSVIICQ